MKMRFARLLTVVKAIRQKPYRFFLPYILTISFALGALTISGCNKEKDNTESMIEASTVSHIEKSESYYQAESLVLYEVSDNEDLTVIGMVSCGEHVAVLYWVNTTENLPDGTYEITSTSYLSFYDSAGNTISTTDINPLIGPGFAKDMTSDTSGNVCLLIEEEELLMVLFIDTSGSLIKDSIRLTPTKPFTASGFELDNVGNIYVYGYDEASMNEIVVFNDTGNQTNVIGDYRLSGDIYRIADRMYASFFDSYSNQGEFLPLLYEIDPIEGILKNPVSIKFGSSGCGTGDGLYMNSQYGVNYINLETLQSTDLFLWADVNADKRLYGSGTMAVISQEVLFFLSNDNDPDKKDNYSVIILRKSTDDPKLEKKTITVAGIWEEGYEPYELTDSILDFNKQSEDYRVVTIGYEAMQLLHLAMLEGVVPDIIIAQQTESLSVFESRGLLLDLYPLMDADIDFHIDDYFENMFTMSEYENHLYKLPTCFSINGLCGLTSQIGDKIGWTVQEANQALLAHGDSQCFSQGLSNSYLLDQCVRNSLSYFIDYETYKCSFETKEFCELLQWSKENGRPDDKPDQGYEIEDPLLISTEFGGPVFYAAVCSEFQKPISVVGYPSPTRNSAMCFFYRQIGITTGAENPEACWNFLKMLLAEDTQRKITENYGFPVKISVFEEQIDKALHPDESLTEPDPFQQGPDVSIPFTEETAQELRDLINGLNTVYPFDESVIKIIMEEATAYFHDQKSAEDVAALIQDRVQTLVNERDRV